MYYYSYMNNLFICNRKLNEYQNLNNINTVKISDEEAENAAKAVNRIFVLTQNPPNVTRRSFSVTDENLLFLENENINILNNTNVKKKIPIWLKNQIKNQKVTSINTLYPTFKDVIDGVFPNLVNNKSKRINVIGLGDVGGTLALGLRLLGSKYIDSIGIYDLDKGKMKRYEFELNQIISPNPKYKYPKITMLDQENLFDCDMFVFCVSAGVPQVEDTKKDVRLVQFTGNSKIIKFYASLARQCNFKGVFAVVSDPVDLLCRYVFETSNKNSNNEFDYKGLAPEQIRGYGLGVMNARACYYSYNTADEYRREGRAFGPHGKGLIIANSIKNYNEDKSDYLTKKTQNANLQLRAEGFKPYIAPAVSSGTLSIIATLKCEYHYSANFIGGTYFGSRNRLTNYGLELETYNFSSVLYKKLEATYHYLNDIYKNL